MIGPVAGTLPSINSREMGTGWGRGCRLKRTGMEGSRKLSEAPESTSASTGMGGWPGMRRCTRRERWQGVGKGKGGVGKGRVPPSQAPTGWDGSFLTDQQLRRRRRRRLKFGGLGAGSRVLGRAPGGKGNRGGMNNRLGGTGNRQGELAAQESGGRSPWPGGCVQLWDRWRSGGRHHHSKRRGQRQTCDGAPPR